MPGLFRAVGLGGDKLCSGCFTGDYPVPVQLEFFADGKLAMERGLGIRDKGVGIRGDMLEVEFDQATMDLDHVPVGAERQL